MKKKALTIICIVCIVFTTFGLLGYIDPTKELRPHKNPIPMPEISLDNKSHVYTEYEEMAKYPGGNEALMKFIKEKVRVPDRVAKAGLRGRLNVSFIIKEDGFIDLDKNSINYFNHLKDKNGNPCNDSALIKLCEEEAYRVVTWMPRWIPGKQNGVPVKVKYNISIEFGKR